MRRHSLTAALLATTLLFPLAARAQTAPNAAGPAADATSDISDVIVVTGSRGKGRTVADSPAPIDVFSGDELQALGANTSLRDALSTLVPSFQTQTVSSSSWDSLVRPAGLRGLSGSHVLVLVNGKRRHNSSLINLSSGNLDNGANPVDIDLIPQGAIGHIEILRDGAAAQYGSDAIAGVINIILKSEDHGGTFTATAGQREPYNYDDHVDGQSLQASLDHAFALPGGGFIDLAVDARRDRATTRSVAATGAFYDTVNGKADPREATANKTVFGGGLPKYWKADVSYNAELPLTDALTAYSFSTVSKRDAFIGQNFRRPNSTNDVPSVYPDGFVPYYTLAEVDFQSLAGLKGKAGGWDWDLSSTYGRDTVDNGATNTINASLGPSSPTSFNTFTSVFSQWTTNLDLTRQVELGLGSPVQVSGGVEHRHERYQTISRDAASYTNGGYIYTSGSLAGKPASVGAQGAITVTPGDQADLDRNNYAAYVDFGFNPTPDWYVDLAGRAEYYDDSAGDTESGKISTRYEILPGVAVRGTISNGFRAPSLAQEGYAQTSNQYTIVNGVSQFITSKSVQVDSAIGKALGATPLRPEESTSYSVGLTLAPTHDISVTIDPYLIYLDNRIAQTGFLSGSAVNAILVANGFSPNQYIKYFTNAIDTRTEGVDVVASYLQHLDELGAGDLGTLRWTAAFNWNRTKITKIRDTPTQLAGLGLTLFDRAAQGAVTVANPETKLILSQEWTVGALALTLRETRYDGVAYLNVNPLYDQFYAPRWLTDIDIAYAVTDRLTIAVGANNVFDVYPSKNTVADTNGFPPYSSISPFGFYGGFYYTRLKIAL
ncbi:TonB-dependent receptor domain-containing protein [Nitrospirillum iridis]|uniref:Iron complex outermembrane receptor protein n=1 Tax=Nitrospirillum iridis TaxID=765888 RepID=A0A7X0B3Z3_9PROT|nr:iron complex outermembrane receptor protein [Nitrospirillum iridis]